PIPASCRTTPSAADRRRRASRTDPEDQGRMSKDDTIAALLAGADPERPAIAAPGRATLSHGGLGRQIERTVERLNRLGLGRNDRIAIVLPNGPAMAAAFLAIGATATTAPLNPAYRDEEFTFYLTDLGAKALVLAAGADSPARAVAARLGVP